MYYEFKQMQNQKNDLFLCTIVSMLYILIIQHYFPTIFYILAHPLIVELPVL